MYFELRLAEASDSGDDSEAWTLGSAPPPLWPLKLDDNCHLQR